MIVSFLFNDENELRAREVEEHWMGDVHKACRCTKDCIGNGLKVESLCECWNDRCLLNDNEVFIHTLAECIVVKASQLRCDDVLLEVTLWRICVLHHLTVLVGVAICICLYACEGGAEGVGTL